MDKGVGGGVSQLTTTLFNAAFFAGMDLPSYMSHTIYIDRYPYGREATLSHPSPDLKIRNPSPHGLLLWTSYSDTSITVTIYSTRWATGEQTNQTKESQGTCTKVRTERTRTYTDGRKSVDSVSALYQKEAGLLCDGRRTDDRGEEPAPGTGNGNGKPEGPPPTEPPPSSNPPTPTTTAAPADAAATAKNPVS
jgi:VanW like protein